MPLAAAYTASKMAIEGFTGSLAHELAAFAAPIFAAFAAPALVTRESDVAAAIWNAVQDGGDRLRYPAGADAIALAGG